MSRLSDESKTILEICYVLIIVSGLGGNFCVVISILSSRKNRIKIQNIFLLSLSLSDLLFCATFPPYILSSLIDSTLHLKNNTVCKGMVFMNYSLALIGLFAITALSLDRYVAIKYPFFYQRYINKFGIYCINVIVWMEPVIFTFPLLAKKNWAIYIGEPGIPSGVIFSSVPPAYSISIAIMCLLLPGMILIVTNIYVFRIAKKQNAKIHNIHGKCREHHNLGSEDGIAENRHSLHGYMETSSNRKCLNLSGNVLKSRSSYESLPSVGSVSVTKVHNRARLARRTEHRQRDWKSAVMTLALVIGFFITWLPFVVSRGIATFTRTRLSFSLEVYTATFTSVNSVSNPYLILATRKDLRNALHKRIQKNNHSE